MEDTSREQQEAHTEYRVNLEVFEGPLDLLVYLIKKNDLDIYDIPIAFLLEAYMSYLDSLRELNIDLAGDFLLMAADLAHIKSKMLLPDEEGTVEEEEPEDPRSDLVRRLLEYQRYKDASLQMTERAMLGRDVFLPQSPERIEATHDGPVEGDVYELVEAFSKILKRVPEKGVHDVAVDRMSISDRIYQIQDMIPRGATTSLEEILKGDQDRFAVVITFIALLEMCRLKMIRVYQSSVYGSIHIQNVMEEVKEEDVIKLVEEEATGFDAPKKEE